jgi:NAD(P)-dependent dehydrogenase (short-subunit alcohol dehydrogenase family)
MSIKGSIVITGVSTGIGQAIAEVLLQAGFKVFGSVRRAADADALVKTWGPAFQPLIFDVTDQAAILRARDQVHSALNGETLTALVNNAGIAVSGPLQLLPVGEFQKQLDVNITGPLRVTQAFLPDLGASAGFTGRPGRIINISSVAGRLVLPFIGPYAVSKHGLEALSDSLRRELQLFGIDVIVIGPGAVVTPIWDKTDELDMSPYRDSAYAPAMTRFLAWFLARGRLGLPANAIGRVALKAITTRRPKARYAVVPKRFSNWTLPLLLSKRALDRRLASALGLSRKPS